MKNNIVNQDIIDRMRLTRVAGHVCAGLELGQTAFVGGVRITAKMEKSNYTATGNTRKRVRYKAVHQKDGWRIMIEAVYDAELYSVRVARMYPDDATTHLSVSHWLAEACR